MIGVVGHIPAAMNWDQSKDR